MRLLDDRKLFRTAFTSYIPSNSYLLKLAPASLQKKFRSRAEDIQSLSSSSSLIVEILYQVGRWFAKRNLEKISDLFVSYSFVLFSRYANSGIANIPNSANEILLIRAGFGSKVSKGDRLFICDASLAHPATLPSLLMSGKFGLTKVELLSRVDRLILHDINLADKILVNSDFVKESFIFAGVDESRITVAYLPPLPHFLKVARSSREDDGKIRLLFAGGLEERKGIVLLRELADTLRLRNIEFELTLIGNWGKVNFETRNALLRNPCVRYLPWVSQEELSDEMVDADIFLFPSYAEGGARVVTEAMALGKAVITTWNSGSPITHGVDGIISELDTASLIFWIERISRDSELKFELESNARKCALIKTSEGQYCEILKSLS
jgi:glycosyltransferase involved in cell wall biosynthesis